MIRNFDESKVSGTGKVLEGAIFSNARVVVYWVGGKFKSFGNYENFFEFYSIHIASHPTNNTVLIFNEELGSIKRERLQVCRHCKNTYEDHPKDKQWEDDGHRRSCSGNLVELTGPGIVIIPNGDSRTFS